MATRRVQTKSVGLPALYCPGHLTPTTDNVYDLGTATKRFRNIYLTGSLSVGAFTATSLTVGTLTGVLKGAAGVVSASTIINADVSASAAIDFSKLAALTSGQILVGSAGNVATAVTPSGDVTISAAGVTSIGNLKVTSGMLAGSIAFTKLATLSSGNVLVGSASNVATSVAVTGDVTISDLGVTTIGATKVTNGMLAGSIAYNKLSLTGAILNADLAGSIDFSKLATLSSANILVGNGSNVAASVAVTGDVTISNAGVTAIGALKVTNAMLAGSIAYNKLSLTGAILNGDLAGSIDFSKLATLSSGNILVGSAGHVATSVAVTGDVAVSNTGVTAIGSNKVTDAMIRQGAALSVIGVTGNATANVADITAGTDGFVLRRSGTALAFGLILNANVDAAAAIAGTKVAPAFGSQNISTTGTLATGTAALTTSCTVTGTTSGNASLSLLAGDTAAASSSPLITWRGNNNGGANTEQVVLEAYYGSSSANRMLGRFNWQNTHATPASAGGQFRISTVKTDGTNTTAMIISETQAVKVPGVSTTASAANCFLDSGDNHNILRSTSSQKYKKNIRDYGMDTSKIYNLRPVEFDDKTSGSRHFGLIAEEVAEHFPLLVQYVPRRVQEPQLGAGTPEAEELIPDGVQYALLGVAILPELKKLRDEVNALKKK